MTIKRLFIISIITFVAVLAASAMSANAQNAGDIVSYSHSLPYTTTKYQASTPVKTGWKVKTKQQFTQTSNYIKKPYHNPNLISELKEKQRQQELKRKQEQEQREKEKQQQLTSMCQFAMMTNYNRRFIYGGPQVVYHRQVSPRVVASYTDYKEVCIPIRRQARYNYSTSSNAVPVMPR